MTGPEGVDNCQKFVDILGLRSIFPVFMKTPKTGKKGAKAEELEGKVDFLRYDWIIIFRESRITAVFVADYGDDMVSQNPRPYEDEWNNFFEKNKVENGEVK